MKSFSECNGAKCTQVTYHYHGWPTAPIDAEVDIHANGRIVVTVRKPEGDSRHEFKHEGSLIPLPGDARIYIEKALAKVKP